MKISLYDKYEKMPVPAKASMWFVVCSIIQKGMAFITTPIFTRLLTSEKFGLVSVYNSWHSILTMILTLQLATGVFNKAMIKYEDKRDEYTSSMLFLTSCITVSGYCIYFVFRNYFNAFFGLNTVLSSAIFLEILFSEAISFWSIRHKFEYKYKSVIGYTLSSNILGTLVSLVLVLLFPKYRVYARVGGTLLVHIIIYSYLYIRIMEKGKRLVWKDAWRYALGYNIPLIPHYLSHQVLSQADRIMINNYCGSSYTAMYTIAYQIAMVLNIITTAICNSFTPWAYQKLKERDNKDIGLVTIKIELATGIICFFFTLFAPEFIYFMGGVAYQEAIWVVPPVCMSILFIMIYSLVSTVTFYFEKTKAIAVSSCVVAIANLILNAIFIPKFGMAAAGYTTLFCYALFSAIHFVLVKKTCKEEGVDNPFNSKVIWGISLVFVLASILCSVLYRITVVRYAVILLMGAIAIPFAYKNKKKIIMFIKK